MTVFKSPYPYFGGKSKIAPIVWGRFGNVTNFVDPFFGSGAVLLRRPGWEETVNWIETVNDKDGFISNFWRSVKSDPKAVAEAADWPVVENDLHARHFWLLQRKEALVEKLEGDPDYYDTQIAGWWAWGMSVWIGGGFCDGKGPWGVEVGGMGVSRRLVHLRNTGMGVSRRLVHLRNTGMGVSRPGLGEAGLPTWMEALSLRFRRVRVCSGDWSRVMGPSVTFKHGITAIFLDPPYSEETGRNMNIYSVDSGSIAHEVHAWCRENGNHPLLRIALCGYKTEHSELEDLGWGKVSWTANGGYALQSNSRGRENRTRETIWFSPHCLPPEQKQMDLYGQTETVEVGEIEEV